MSMIIPDSTNQSLYFYLQDAVSGAPYTTTGGETDFNLSYVRDGAVIVTNNVAGALASAVVAHADNEIFHCGKGFWRADFPDAPFASGVDRVQLLMDHNDGIVLAQPLEMDLLSGATAAIVNTFANIDSTATETISVIQGMEIMLAIMGGNAVYDSGTRVWTIYARDGITELWTVKESATVHGTRTNSTKV